jgi:hypothetical protein
MEMTDMLRFPTVVGNRDLFINGKFSLFLGKYLSVIVVVVLVAWSPLGIRGSMHIPIFSGVKTGLRDCLFQDGRWSFEIGEHTQGPPPVGEGRVTDVSTMGCNFCNTLCAVPQVFISGNSLTGFKDENIIN